MIVFIVAIVLLAIFEINWILGICLSIFVAIAAITAVLSKDLAEEKTIDNKPFERFVETLNTLDDLK